MNRLNKYVFSTNNVHNNKISLEIKKKKKPALGKIEVAVSERFCPSKGNPQPRTEGTNSYSLCLKMGSILCCNLGRLDFT